MTNKIATSQMALPKAACDLVYATSGYSASVNNLSQVSLATDNVFSDGSSLELATVAGSIAAGLTATITVASSPDLSLRSGSIELRFAVTFRRVSRGEQSGSFVNVDVLDEQAFLSVRQEGLALA